MFNINLCQLLDSNCKPLESESTALPTEPQQLVGKVCFYIYFIFQDANCKIILILEWFSEYTNLNKQTCPREMINIFSTFSTIFAKKFASKHSFTFVILWGSSTVVPKLASSWYKHCALRWRHSKDNKNEEWAGSVTRFGEISPIWQYYVSLLAITKRLN